MTFLAGLTPGRAELFSAFRRETSEETDAAHVVACSGL